MSKLKVSFTDNLVPDNCAKVEKAEQGNPTCQPEQPPQEKEEKPAGKPLVSLDEMFGSDEPLHKETQQGVLIHGMTPLEYADRRPSLIAKDIQAGVLDQAQLEALRETELANRRRKTVLAALDVVFAPQVNPETEQSVDDQDGEPTPENLDGDTQIFGCANNLIENAKTTFLAPAPQEKPEGQPNQDVYEELQTTLNELVNQAERMERGVYLQVGDSDLYGVTQELVQSTYRLRDTVMQYLAAQ